MANRLLPQPAKLRARGLLDMLYSPEDLAFELQIDKRAIYRKLIPAGLPCRKDDTGHVWVHGPEAARWILSLGKTKAQPMAADEGYCFKCKKPVKMSARPKKVKRMRMTMLTWPCPECGTMVNRGMKKARGGAA